jgi:transposase
MIVKKISKQVAEMYLEGKSIETIAEELDVCYRTARKAVWAEGIELRDPSTRLKGRTRPTKVTVTEESVNA